MNPADSGPGRHVGKGSVSIIMQKLVVLHAADIEVDRTIVVVVACGYPHAIARSLQAGFDRYVAEGSVAVVAIKAVVILGLRLFKRGDRRSVREKQVEPSIVVVI